ncbi:hypothetical protein M2272_001073 [Mycobacterium frederiksbergense]|uniref:DUF4333 domain-containing protein n=1 Tax=Mycolicibacterium frederiksbergense TaxID=117567 RepID=A0ABT6KUQ5_9MYCO|nr:DUF4333 domain-containing protein [Mycolicibacterium frederiksbergense]MDH6194444.1 hypothetical protein [Mycolicibacterium frederiksbergense]
MTGPEPWWVRPGGAPPPGAPPARPGWNPPPAPRAQPPRRPPADPQPTAPVPAPPNTRRAKPAGRRPLIRPAIAVSAAVAVAVVGAGLWAWTRADTGGTRLDVRQAEAGVAQILSDPINGYGANRVVAVACNNGENPVVRVGATFICAVEINNTLRRVTVEFTHDDGTYAVDGPR